MDRTSYRGKDGAADPQHSRWKAYLYHYLAASLVLATTAHLTIEFVPGVRTWAENPLFEEGSATDTGRLRALIYLILGYASLVPIYFFKFDRLLRASPPPKKGLSDKIFLTLFGVIFLGAFVLIPFGFALMANVAAGRASVFVSSFTGSFIGLVIGGAFLLYSVTFGFWLLLRGIPRLWIGQSWQDI